MKLKNILLVVKDIDQSVLFYHNILGLNVIMDFGANKILTGHLCLQTYESYKEFIQKDTISFGGNNAEIYFEEDDFDLFLAQLKQHNIHYVHPVKEHTWGQRVVRFYDPDLHIIEVGENMQNVCRRFYESGMSIEDVAKRMDVPLQFVKDSLM